MTQPGSRFSVGVPQVLDGADPSLLTRFAVRAEELGFEGLWTLDSAAGGPTARAPVLDGIHSLTFVAAVTRRVRLGAAVIVLPRRNPVLLAKELATLDQLSGGRLIAGVGLGHDDGEVAQQGFPTDRPTGRLIEGMAVMRAAWRQGPARHEGDLWRFADAPVEPKPVQQRLPIWIGAGGPRSLRRVARHADGWIGAGGASPEEFASSLAVLTEALAVEGRDRSGFPCAKRVYIGVESTSTRARDRHADALHRLYGIPGFADRVGVHGTRQECADALRRFLEAGADELMLTPTYDYERQLEELAAVVALIDG